MAIKTMSNVTALTHGNRVAGEDKTQKRENQIYNFPLSPFETGGWGREVWSGTVN